MFAIIQRDNNSFSKYTTNLDRGIIRNKAVVFHIVKIKDLLYKTPNLTQFKLILEKYSTEELKSNIISLQGYLLGSLGLLHIKGRFERQSTV